MYRALAFLPQHYLAYLVGRLAHVRLPKPLATWAVKLFASRYGINVSEAALPLEAYPSIGDFFIRELREGCRPIQAGLVSPIDGYLRAHGEIQDGLLLQIKGKPYSLAQFLQSDELAEQYAGGYFFNLYLSPKDYHHVHAPIAGQITSSTYIPGSLWPVNDWSVKNVDGLFAQNERLLMHLKTAHGNCLVAMVGAMNVGKMSTPFDSWEKEYRLARRSGPREKLEKQYSQPYSVGKGDALGTFHLGSSVILLLAPSIIEKTHFDTTHLPMAVRLGESFAPFAKADIPAGDISSQMR